MRALLSSPQPVKTKAPAKRQAKRPRLQRPASTTTLLTSPTISQQALQPQQFTVLSPITLSSVGQPFTMAGLPIASLAQSSNTVTLIPAGSQLFTRYMVTGGDGKADTITLHSSSGLTLLGTAMQDPGQLGTTMVSPMELVQLTQQAGGGADGMTLEGHQVVDGAVLLQEEVMEGEESQGHTVIEINPAPVEQAMGVMALQLSGEPCGDGGGTTMQEGVEMTVVTEGDGEGMLVQGATEGEESQGQMQAAQTEGIQGLQLDANGQLSDIQIVVIEDNTQGENKVK